MQPQVQSTNKMNYLVKAKKCKSNVESLLGGSSRGAATHIPLTKTSPPLLGKVFLFYQPHSLGRHAVRVVREEEAPA